MAEHGFFWIYLIFFLIPLARIVPRLIKKWQKKNNTVTENQIVSGSSVVNKRKELLERTQNKEMQVLGEINRGVKDFSKIQKNLGITNQELESILKDFEEQGLMNVVKKKGMFGVKIELHSTEKGFRRYYS